MTQQAVATATQPVKFSGIAITGFILTVIGLLTIPAIVIGIGLTGFGLMFSIAGLADKKHRGHGFAVAGLLIGVAAVMLIIFTFIRTA